MFHILTTKEAELPKVELYIMSKDKQRQPLLYDKLSNLKRYAIQNLHHSEKLYIFATKTFSTPVTSSMLRFSLQP